VWGRGRRLSHTPGGSVLDPFLHSRLAGMGGTAQPPHQTGSWRAPAGCQPASIASYGPPSAQCPTIRTRAEGRRRCEIVQPWALAAGAPRGLAQRSCPGHLEGPNAHAAACAASPPSGAVCGAAASASSAHGSKTRGVARRCLKRQKTGGKAVSRLPCQCDVTKISDQRADGSGPVTTGHFRPHNYSSSRPNNNSLRI